MIVGDLNDYKSYNEKYEKDEKDEIENSFENVDIEYEYLDVFDYLKTHNFDKIDVNDDNDTILLKSIQDNLFHYTLDIITIYSTKCNFIELMMMSNNEGNNAILLSICQKKPEIATKIIDILDDYDVINNYINHRNNDGDNALLLTLYSMNNKKYREYENMERLVCKILNYSPNLCVMNTIGDNALITSLFTAPDYIIIRIIDMLIKSYNDIYCKNRFYISFTINYINNNNDSAILFALTNKKLKIIQKLLEFENLNFSNVDKQKNNCLLLCLKNSINDDIYDLFAKKLIHEENYLQNYVNNKNENALLYALKCKKPELAHLMLSNSELNIYQIDNDGNTPLLLSIINGYDDIAMRILTFPKTNVEYYFTSASTKNANETEKKKKYVKKLRSLFNNIHTVISNKYLMTTRKKEMLKNIQFIKYIYHINNEGNNALLEAVKQKLENVVEEIIINYYKYNFHSYLNHKNNENESALSYIFNDGFWNNIIVKYL